MMSKLNKRWLKIWEYINNNYKVIFGYEVREGANREVLHAVVNITGKKI